MSRAPRPASVLLNSLLWVDRIFVAAALRLVGDTRIVQWSISSLETPEFTLVLLHKETSKMSHQPHRGSTIEFAIGDPCLTSNFLPWHRGVRHSAIPVSATLRTTSSEAFSQGSQVERLYFFSVVSALFPTENPNLTVSNVNFFANEWPNDVCSSWPPFLTCFFFESAAGFVGAWIAYTYQRFAFQYRYPLNLGSRGVVFTWICVSRGIELGILFMQSSAPRPVSMDLRALVKFQFLRSLSDEL
jgi:hypothetical protein